MRWLSGTSPLYLGPTLWVRKQPLTVFAGSADAMGRDFIHYVSHVWWSLQYTTDGALSQTHVYDHEEDIDIYQTKLYNEEADFYIETAIPHCTSLSSDPLSTYMYRLLTHLPLDGHDFLLIFCCCRDLTRYKHDMLGVLQPPHSSHCVLHAPTERLYSVATRSSPLKPRWTFNGALAPLGICGRLS